MLGVGDCIIPLVNLPKYVRGVRFLTLEGNVQHRASLSVRRLSVEIDTNKDYLELVYWFWMYFSIVVIIWYGLYMGWWIFA